MGGSSSEMTGGRMPPVIAYRISELVDILRLVVGVLIVFWVILGWAISASVHDNHPGIGSAFGAVYALTIVAILIYISLLGDDH